MVNLCCGDLFGVSRSTAGKHAENGCKRGLDDKALKQMRNHKYLGVSPLLLTKYTELDLGQIFDFRECCCEKDSRDAIGAGRVSDIWQLCNAA